MTEGQWLARATHARDQARRASAQAATTPFPDVAERFESAATLLLGLAQTWSEFATRERALATAGSSRFG